MIDRIQKRLAGWKRKMLSLEARITMVNAVLSSMPTYFLYFFAIPRWVEREFDNLRRKFSCREHKKITRLYAW